MKALSIELVPWFLPLKHSLKTTLGSIYPYSLPARSFAEMNSAKLSPCQIEALYWMAEGDSNLGIAKQLQIAKTTDREHVQSIL